MLSWTRVGSQSWLECVPERRMEDDQHSMISVRNVICDTASCVHDGYKLY